MSNVLNEYVPSETIQFPSQIRFHSNLNFGEKVFLAEIQDMSARGNPPVLSSRALSKMFGVSHQTILNWVNKLTSMGFLEVECKFANSRGNRLILKHKPLSVAK